MELLFKLLPAVFQAFLTSIFHPMFFVVLLLIAFLHRRQAKLKEALFGFRDETMWHHTLISLFFGLVGGLVGSYLMVLFGISITEIGIGYLWMVAVGLMLINPRFLCFSYSGGLISLSYILFDFPKVDVPQLMGLVAILHMIESLLILVSGHMGAIPIYARNASGKVVGGYNLQRFWPIPIVALVIVPTASFPGEWFNMPGWWPLIKPDIPGDLDTAIYVMYPVLAALGYGDLAVTRLPQEKSRHSASVLGVYSVSLLCLSVLASHYKSLSFLPALFGPLVHELTIKMGQRSELKGTPVFINPPEGVMVLEVLRGSVAERLGLKPRDVIRNINGLAVNNKMELLGAFSVNSWWTELEYLDADTGEIKTGVARKKIEEPLGVILVPGMDDRPNVNFRTQGILVGKLKKLKNRIFNQNNRKII